MLLSKSGGVNLSPRRVVFHIRFNLLAQQSKVPLNFDQRRQLEPLRNLSIAVFRRLIFNEVPERVSTNDGVHFEACNEPIDRGRTTFLSAFQPGGTGAALLRSTWRFRDRCPCQKALPRCA
jgi:hypothetical protein